MSGGWSGLLVRSYRSSQGALTGQTQHYILSLTKLLGQSCVQVGMDHRGIIWGLVGPMQSQRSCELRPSSRDISSGNDAVMDVVMG